MTEIIVPGCYDPSRFKIYEKFDEEPDRYVAVGTYHLISKVLVLHTSQPPCGSVAPFKSWDYEKSIATYDLSAIKPEAIEQICDISILKENFTQSEFENILYGQFLEQNAPSLSGFNRLLASHNGSTIRTDLLIDDVTNMNGKSPIIYLRLGTVEKYDNPDTTSYYVDQNEPITMFDRSKLYSLHLASGEVYEHDGYGNYALEDPSIWKGFGKINVTHPNNLRGIPAGIPARESVIIG